MFFSETVYKDQLVISDNQLDSAAVINAQVWEDSIITYIGLF